MKRFVLWLFLIFLVGNCFGSVLNITENHIFIYIDEEGNTSVVEKYYLFFPDEGNKQAVLGLNQEYGIDLVMWNKENNKIMTHIGEAKNAKVLFIEDQKEGISYLQLKYELKEPIVLKKSETTRNILYYLNKKNFERFTVGTLWVIPEATAISIVLPLNATLSSIVQPNSEVFFNEGRTEILWRGYLSTTELKVEYTQIKKITIDISQIIVNFTKSEYFIPSMAVLLLLVVIFIFKRKEIEGKIEEFIIKNSYLD